MESCLYQCFSHWGKTDGVHNNAIWLYSDPHFNDSEMSYIRKNYISDEEQIKRINSKVGKHDTIIFLGDIGDLSFIKKIHGYKVLIQGNHDSGKSNYLRQTYTKKIDCEMYIECKEKSFKDVEACDNYIDKIEHEGFLKALSELKTLPEFCSLDPYIYSDPCHKPFMSWTARFDNNLFDEVYDGTLQINSKILLSHEPVEYSYCYNIHGHDHSNWSYQDNLHLNICAEHINYTPINLKDIIKSGVLKNIPDIHREAIDRQRNKGE